MAPLSIFQFPIPIPIPLEEVDSNNLLPRFSRDRIVVVSSSPGYGLVASSPDWLRSRSKQSRLRSRSSLLFSIDVDVVSAKENEDPI